MVTVGGGGRTALSLAFCSSSSLAQPLTYSPIASFVVSWVGGAKFFLHREHKNTTRALLRLARYTFLNVDKSGKWQGCRRWRARGNLTIRAKNSLALALLPNAARCVGTAWKCANLFHYSTQTTHSPPPSQLAVEFNFALKVSLLFHLLPKLFHSRCAGPVHCLPVVVVYEYSERQANEWGQSDQNLQTNE